MRSSSYSRTIILSLPYTPQNNGVHHVVKKSCPITFPNYGNSSPILKDVQQSDSVYFVLLKKSKQNMQSSFCRGLPNSRLQLCNPSSYSRPKLSEPSPGMSVSLLLFLSSPPSLISSLSKRLRK